MVHRYIIPLPPVTKKNSQQIYLNRRTGKPFVVQSNTYRQYERQALDYLRLTSGRTSGPINGPVNVKTVFYMPTRRRCDLVNLQEAILDILVKAGILTDDNAKVVISMDGSRVLYDKERPRTEIEITGSGD